MPPAGIFENQRSNGPLTIIVQIHQAVQAGTPMTVTGEGPLFSLSCQGAGPLLLWFVNIPAGGIKSLWRRPSLTPDRV